MWPALLLHLAWPFLFFFFSFLELLQLIILFIFLFVPLVPFSISSAKELELPLPLLDDGFFFSSSAPILSISFNFAARSSTAISLGSRGSLALSAKLSAFSCPVGSGNQLALLPPTLLLSLFQLPLLLLITLLGLVIAFVLLIRSGDSNLTLECALCNHELKAARTRNIIDAKQAQSVLDLLLEPQSPH